MATQMSLTKTDSNIYSVFCFFFRYAESILLSHFSSSIFVHQIGFNSFILDRQNVFEKCITSNREYEKREDCRV